MPQLVRRQPVQAGEIIAGLHAIDRGVGDALPAVARGAPDGHFLAAAKGRREPCALLRNPLHVEAVDQPPRRLVHESEIRGAGGACEGDHVADVADAGDEHQHALKAEPEAGVGHAAVAAQVEVPPVGLLVEVVQRHQLGLRVGARAHFLR